MLRDTVELITEVVGRYGSEENLLLLTKDAGHCVTDFVPSTESSGVSRNHLKLPGSPLDHIRKNAPTIAYTREFQSVTEALPFHSQFNGPLILDSVLEREPEPFAAIRLVAQQLSKDGYLVVVSSMSSPDLGDGDDRWRFTPAGLGQLLSNANLYVLESGWRLQLHGSSAIRGSTSNDLEQLFTCYAVAAKRELPTRAGAPFILPVLEPEQTQASTTRSQKHDASPERTPAHRCVFLNTCYDAFLQHHYAINPQLLAAGYQEQLDALSQTFFGDSDFYSRGLRACGFEAIDLVINCGPLQQAWAAERNISASGFGLVQRQLETLKPDVVYVQDMAGTPRDVLLHARAHGALIVGQIACELAQSVPLDAYDIVFSSFPHFVDAFRQAGLTSYYQLLAFEPRILEAIGNVPFEARDIECSFIGGLSSFHQAGTQLLEKLASETPLQIWGYGGQQVPPSSAIAQRHRGEAWGRQMFSLFNRSKITINRHSEAASTNANNMRLFEATGAGALLITDYKDNLNQLFEIGEEIVAYRSPEECVGLIRYYQQHPDEAKAIAQAGQRRTLRDHSYQSRMQKTAEILARHIEYRKVNIAVPDVQKISSDFKPLSAGAHAPELAEAWKNPGMAMSQRGLVQRELETMYRGTTPTPFLIAARLLSPIVKRGATVLEVGCSSGYYYEALEYLLKKPLSYTGCDYSEAMIQMARAFYPQAAFDVADGAALPYSDRAFEVVISGCVLLHCPNYAEHIKESCRVTQKYLLLHRTPISLSGQTRFFEKLAYGVPTVEIWFSQEEILDLFSKHGFELVERDEYSADVARQVSNVSYLLRARADV